MTGTKSGYIEKVVFKNKKEYVEITQEVLRAIEGKDKQAVEAALDKILQLYPSSTKIIIWNEKCHKFNF